MNFISVLKSSCYQLLDSGIKNGDPFKKS